MAGEEDKKALLASAGKSLPTIVQRALWMTEWALGSVEKEYNLCHQLLFNTSSTLAQTARDDGRWAVGSVNKK